MNSIKKKNPKLRRGAKVNGYEEKNEGKKGREGTAGIFQKLLFSPGVGSGRSDPGLVQRE